MSAPHSPRNARALLALAMTVGLGGIESTMSAPPYPRRRARGLFDNEGDLPEALSPRAELAAAEKRARKAAKLEALAAKGAIARHVSPDRGRTEE